MDKGILQRLKIREEIMHLNSIYGEDILNNKESQEVVKSLTEVVKSCLHQRVFVWPYDKR